jgi:TetR/AcrR family transcriptional regulator, regulator of mycofactocin system
VTSQPLAQQLSVKRAEMMALEVEAVALDLFAERGFGEVTVEEIASAASISARTFYRYFASKEDVLQLRIDRRTAALRVALATRPVDEPPLHSLRTSLEEVVAVEDLDRLRVWASVIAGSPSVVNGVLGGIQLKTQQAMAEFLGDRLGVPSGDLVPTMLAAAVGGVIQAAHIQWYVDGRDLATTIAEGLGVLERGIGTDPTTWSSSEDRAR